MLLKLKQIRPSWLAPSSRPFTTSAIHTFQIRKIFVDDETIIANKKKYDEAKKKQWELDRKMYGGRLKPLYQKYISEYKQIEKKAKQPVIPVKFSHPLMVVDVSNTMSERHSDKFFSHIGAATDLHREFRRIMTINEEQPKTVNVEINPEVPPKIEIVLVLEKLFRQGAYEGTIGNGEVWVRTVHAPDTRDINQNAGDNAIILVVERARQDGRDVTLVTKDKTLGRRANSFGGKVLSPTDFVREMDAADPTPTTLETSKSFGSRMLELAKSAVSIPARDADVPVMSKRARRMLHQSDQ